MLARLLLGAALFAPQTSTLAHAFETAREEANHPICLSGSAAHVEPGSNHRHHDDHGCTQCPRPAPVGLQAAPALQAAAAPSFIKPVADGSQAGGPLLPRPSRGPPSR